MKFKLPVTVIVLGLASFFTDTSSEMIYPLLPVFLAQTLGASALALGLIEGVAEATASLFKVYSGFLTDRSGRRKNLIFGGYAISGAARPLIGLAGSWPVVLGLRFVDRVGKGIRTSPRDALIADVTETEQRGRAYGLHRAMDHAGSISGPLVAGALLGILGLNYRSVFLLAAIPAALTLVILWFGVKDDAASTAKTQDAQATPSISWRAWRSMGPEFKWILTCVVIFTLGNSTDAFLLLRLNQAGVPAAWITTLWALLHVVKMSASWFGGLMSDRWGHRKMIFSGWLFYAAIYAAFSVASEMWSLIGIFIAYGLFFGFTEPSERALVASFAAPEQRGIAFGTFHFAVGIAALPASLLFGFLWQQFGSATAFRAGAALALLASLMLLSPRLSRENSGSL